MTAQLLVKLDETLKQRLAKLARTEGKNTSQLVRELVEGYVKERDIGPYMDELWDRVGRKLKMKGVKARDVVRIVKAVRRAKARA